MRPVPRATLAVLIAAGAVSCVRAPVATLERASLVASRGFEAKLADDVLVLRIAVHAARPTRFNASLPVGAALRIANPRDCSEGQPIPLFNTLYLKDVVPTVVELPAGTTVIFVVRAPLEVPPGTAVPDCIRGEFHLAPEDEAPWSPVAFQASKET